jgi:GH15 family glucan-1,4-alpha-glucosidase
MGFRSLKDQGSPPPPTPEALEAIFPPIGDYAFLSDCENTLLVAPTGSIEWMCLPKPHDPSLFGTILDRSAGSFRLAPIESSVPAHRQYLPGTMVLSTTWQTRSGWLEVNDFLAIGPWYRTGERSTLQRRTPGDSDARHVLVRTAKCLHGSVDVASQLRAVVQLRPRGRGVGVHRYVSYDHVSTTNADYNRITVTGDMRFGIEGRALRARHRLVEGESCFVVMSWTDAPLPTTQEEVNLFKSETSRFWRGWIDGGSVPGPPVARVVAAKRADVEGTLLRTDRRDPRRADDVAPGEPRRIA